VKVVYSDETGTDGDEARNPLTVVAAVMLNMDSQWRQVSHDIEAAISRTMNPRDLSRYMIKGKTLYHKIERGEMKARELMGRLMVIPRRHGIQVFFGAVHRKGFKRQMTELRQRGALADPYRMFRLAFEDCMVRVDNYVQTALPKEEVLWIHDSGSLNSPTKQTLRSFRLLLQEIENEAREMENAAWARDDGVLPQEHISHVADMIYFGDDEESRLLQLADYCCSTIARHLRNDPIAKPFYDILRLQVVNDGTMARYNNAEESFDAMHRAIAKRRGRSSV
jgi:hypothetical protein